MSGSRRFRFSGFWSRSSAILIKGIHPVAARPCVVRHDRDGAADPVAAVRLRHQHSATLSPTAVLLQEQSDLGRTILGAMENTRYFTIKYVVRTEEEFDELIKSGTVLFRRGNSANFERAVRRGDRPAMLVAADMDRSGGASTALGALNMITQTALQNERGLPESGAPLFEIHALRATIRPPRALNIVPGLIGTILTMTMLIFTALSVTREIEARYDGKPAGHADHAGRDHGRQDHSLCVCRLPAGGSHSRHRHFAVRRALSSVA